jgi:hypothetical protein
MGSEGTNASRALEAERNAQAAKTPEQAVLEKKNPYLKADMAKVAAKARELGFKVPDDGKIDLASLDQLPYGKELPPEPAPSLTPAQRKLVSQKAMLDALKQKGTGKLTPEQQKARLAKAKSVDLGSLNIDPSNPNASTIHDDYPLIQKLLPVKAHELRAESLTHDLSNPDRIAELVNRKVSVPEARDRASRQAATLRLQALQDKMNPTRIISEGQDMLKAGPKMTSGDLLGAVAHPVRTLAGKLAAQGDLFKDPRAQAAFLSNAVQRLGKYQRLQPFLKTFVVGKGPAGVAHLLKASETDPQVAQELADMSREQEPTP